MKFGTGLKMAVGLLAFATFSLIACRVYYAFVFVPEHHGGWTERWWRLTDFEVWWAFVSNPIGLVLNLMWIVPLVLAVGVLVYLWLQSNRTTPRNP